MQLTLAEESILAEESAKSSANSSVQQGCQLVLDPFLSNLICHQYFQVFVSWQPWNLPIPWLTSVSSTNVGCIGHHRLASIDYRLTSSASLRYPMHLRSPTAKLPSSPDGIGAQSKPSHRIGIVIGFGRSPSVPGLVWSNR